MVVLKPGDVVVFKKDRENQSYRERNDIQEPMMLIGVSDGYATWYCPHKGRKRDCYIKRVELQEGPW